MLVRTEYKKTHQKMQNRRDFLKTTACALGAVAIGGGHSSAMSLCPEPKKHKLKEGAFMHGFVAPKLDTMATRNHCFQQIASPGTGSYIYLDRIGEFLEFILK